MKSSAYIQQITSLTKDGSNLLYPCTMYITATLVMTYDRYDQLLAIK